MLNCFLPSEDETQINFKFPDNQEPLVVDAIDIANMIDIVRAAGIPEDSTTEAEIARAFHKKYNRKISKTAAGVIWETSYKVMQDVKKKSYLEPEQLDATDTQDLPQENSISSIQ